MSNKKGKSKGASADGDSGEASGGKGGTSVKVIEKSIFVVLIEGFFFSPLRFDIFYAKNNQKLWKPWRRSIVE